jgi:hypothetical protein
MAQANVITSPAFLMLPGELHIKVYEKLLEDFTGDTTPLQGALLSCRQLKREIEHELPGMFLESLTTTVRSIQQTWASHFPTAGPLLATLPAAHTPLNEMHLQISMPKSVFLAHNEYGEGKPRVPVLETLPVKPPNRSKCLGATNLSCAIIIIIVRTS